MLVLKTGIGEGRWRSPSPALSPLRLFHSANISLEGLSMANCYGLILTFGAIAAKMRLKSPTCWMPG